ncbi:FGGY-family carbohydrate kinase [Fusobacterium sp.]|uniref:FGGY-family carbohydrate kinase n=1 Tax=Fusobacterium sp. TaxID=68766 RepID=UPI00396CDAD3
MKKYYIGFDAGTQSVKVAVYNLEMECIAEKNYPTKLYYPKAGWVEMDVDEYLEAAKNGIRDCITELKRKKIDPKDIRAVFGDGIICGIVGVDENGDAITPYINYLDSRCQKDADEIAEKNLQIWGKETGNARPSCMFPALIARWFLKNNDDFKAKGRKFMHNAPYILSHLAGLKGENAFVDWGTMSGWGLGFNVYKKEWSDEQLEILGIDRKFMPKILKPWDIVGGISKEIAEYTGLEEGTPVCAGAGDTMQSMLGCGLTEKDMAADVAGTCAMFCVSTDGIKPELSTPDSGLIFNSGTLPDTYFYWGFIRTGGLALRWFRDNICDKKSDEGYFDFLSEKAENIPCGSDGVLFLPYLTGGSPEAPDACGCFMNITMDTDQGTLWRAVLEAIGYDYIGVTDIYRKAGVSLKEITVTEGGSKSELWNQIKSDMLDTKVKTLKNATGAVMTNILTAAYAVGDIGNLKESLEVLLAPKKVYTPVEENTRYYRSIYNLRKEMLETDMNRTFEKLKKIR